MLCFKTPLTLPLLLGRVKSVAQRQRCVVSALDDTHKNLHEKRRQRILQELTTAAARLNPSVSSQLMQDGVTVLETLLPGFTPNLDLLKMSDWVKIIVGHEMVAKKIVLLKIHYPKMDIPFVICRNPKLLLDTPEEISRKALQVNQLLASAIDKDIILQEVPQLMEPRVLMSVLVTVNKWYFGKEDPIKILSRDPDLIRRAQDNDVPFEPVYEDGNGGWVVPSLNYAEKKAPWQAYIDRVVYKQAK